MLATGIQIDGPILRRATVKRTYQDLHILDLKTFAIHEKKVKPLYFDNAGTLVSGLTSSDLIIRTIPISTTVSRKLKKALVLQAESQLHLKPDELITNTVINAKTKHATTYSTTRSALAAHLGELVSLQLDPERVGAIPTALKTFIRWKTADVSSYFLLDLGWATTNWSKHTKTHVSSGHIIISTDYWFMKGIHDPYRKNLVVHEACHIISNYLYGYDTQHDENWKKTMRLCGELPIEDVLYP